MGSIKVAQRTQKLYTREFKGKKLKPWSGCVTFDEESTLARINVPIVKTYTYFTNSTLLTP